ncbi:MAG: hypothetical protein ACK587_04275 [Cyanobacteriota bacterium]
MKTGPAAGSEVAGHQRAPGLELEVVVAHDDAATRLVAVGMDAVADHRRQTTKTIARIAMEHDLAIDLEKETVSSEPPLRKLASTGFWVRVLGKYTTICTTTFPGLGGMGWDIVGRQAGSLLLTLLNAWGR